MGLLDKKSEPSMAEMMVEMHESMLHLAETAQGYRTSLEGMGWSPAMAEQIAAHFLIQMHEKAFQK